ncbi:coiled-coil domain-containing protein 136-like [Drosophila virilis]|uniref:coiled-coil domain-containing protein 136-like n=1 Tax=Drosophila virilis TaxID=7244 RepID=UPI0013966549|nr:uncharacterized protein LOC116651651 [Drosophila virilis]
MEPLGKDNYETWKVQMQAVLIKNDLWNYVNGTHVRTEANSLQWETEDAKAKSEIVLAMTSSELKHVKNCETSNDMWKELHSIYQAAWPARKAVLLKSLILLKMESGGDMRQHVDKFFDIADKLNAVEQVVKDDLLSTFLLYSMPEEYEPFRIAIELQDNLPTPDDLRMKFLNEYEVRYRYKRETSQKLQEKCEEFNNLRIQNNIEVVSDDQRIITERHQQLKMRSEEAARPVLGLELSRDTHPQDAPSSELCMQQELDELQCKYKNLQREHETLLHKTHMICDLKAKVESAINKLHDDYAAMVLELVQQFAKYEDAADEQDEQDEQEEQDEQDQIDILEQNLCAKRDELFKTLETADEHEDDDDEQEQSRKKLIELIDCIEKNLSERRVALEKRQHLMKLSTEEPLVDGNAEKALVSIAPNSTNSKGNFLLARMKDLKNCTLQALASIFDPTRQRHEMLLVGDEWRHGTCAFNKMLGLGG